MRRTLTLLILAFFSCSSADEQVEYYENGSEKIVTQYENGKINGQRIEYYKNGEIKSIVDYQGGVVHGESKQYYDNGKIKSTAKYINGMLDGEVKHFYRSGSLRSVAEWRNDQPHGTNKILYENGNPQYIVAYDSGLRIDTSKFYYENGVLKEKKLYNKGEVAYFQFFSKDGEIVADFIEPKISFNKDTVKLGERLILVTDARYDLVGKVSIDIGQYDELNDIFHSDTTIVKKHNTTTIYYEFVPTNTGADSLSVRFNHEYELDEKTLDGLIKRVRYFVIG